MLLLGANALPLRAAAPGLDAFLRRPTAFPAGAAPGDPVPLAGAPVPFWLKVEGDPAKLAKSKRRLLDAAVLSGRTPTGKELARTLTAGGGRVLLREQGSFLVSDSENAVIGGPGFIESFTAPILVPLFAHELEHLVQGQSGIKGPEARGLRELGAFLVQCRVWVESGAPIRAADWERNGANSRDMWSWIDYPVSAMAALAYRSGLEFGAARPRDRAYWSGVLSDEAAWRARNAGAMPRGKDGREAALFILRQATGFGEISRSGDVSAGLPDFLERAARMAAPPELPASASEKDRALYAALRPLLFP